jgi:hypothetical protein
LNPRNYDVGSVIRLKVYHHFSRDNSKQILGRITLLEKHGVRNELTGDKERVEQP